MRKRVRPIDTIVVLAVLCSILAAFIFFGPPLSAYLDRGPKIADCAVVETRLQVGETLWHCMRSRCHWDGDSTTWLDAVSDLNGWSENYVPNGERFKALVVGGGKPGGADPVVTLTDRGAAPGAVGPLDRPTTSTQARGSATHVPPDAVANAAPPSPSRGATSPRVVQTGLASWYRYRPGQAAHRSAPKGSRLRVVSVEHPEHSVTVVITDRGPNIHTSERIIDLHREDFARLASPSRGLTRVRIERSER